MAIELPWGGSSGNLISATVTGGIEVEPYPELAFAPEELFFCDSVPDLSKDLLEWLPG